MRKLEYLVVFIISLLCAIKDRVRAGDRAGVIFGCSLQLSYIQLRLMSNELNFCVTRS